MYALICRVDCYATENSLLKKKVGNLEVANRSLILQVQKLQALVASKMSTQNDSHLKNNDESCEDSKEGKFLNC